MMLNLTLTDTNNAFETFWSQQLLDLLYGTTSGAAFGPLVTSFITMIYLLRATI